MRVLVTGSGGFVGRHVTAELAAHGHVVYGFDRGARPPPPGLERNDAGDIRDRESIGRVVREVRPDACIHLAGIAFMPEGWTHPDSMFAVNLLGTVNLLETFREARPHARILFVSTAHVYGFAAASEPVGEDSPLAPANVYAISKAAADQLALVYARHHGMPVIVARPHNHIGPGQTAEFVVPAFAAQLRAIARGAGAAVLDVGNLDSERDFVDVRDVTRGYRLLLEKGTPGRAYNLCSGQRVTIRRILDELCALAGVRPETRTDPRRYRETDRSLLLDTTRIRCDTGWEPRIGLSTTLHDVYAAS